MQNVFDLIHSPSILSAIVIRHAQRYEICGAEDYWTCGLTEAGTEAANEFGRHLNGSFDSYRIFYSPVKRCQQTAESIASQLDGKVMSLAPEKMLGVSYIRVDIPKGFTEADNYPDFIRDWFDGRVPADIFKPLAETRDEHIAYMRSRLSEIERPHHLDIHVTHDWNINVLREGIFGLRHEDIGWPDFLSGLGFAREPGEIFALLFDGTAIRRQAV